MESKWASLMSYGMTTKLLEEALPLKTHHSSVMYNAQQTAIRLEQELGEEQYMFISGCQNELRKLPNPGGSFNCQYGRWLYTCKLRDQGMRMNQQVTFLTDGGDKVQELQYYMSFNSEHILDWFHITMKITVMRQMAKGVSTTNEHLKINEELERIKWYIWHGNICKALKVLDSLQFDLEIFCDQKNSNGYKLWKAASEFYEYVNSNSHLIPNYGDRYRHGEAISSSIAESTVNELISKRMSKKQQMRWTRKGAHLLLQLRVKTLDEKLGAFFYRWYPQMSKEELTSVPLAA